MNTWNKRSKIKKKQTEDSLQYDLLTGFSSNTVLDYIEGGTNNNFKKIGWYKYKYFMSYWIYLILVTIFTTIFWVVVSFSYYMWWEDASMIFLDIFIPIAYITATSFYWYKFIIELKTWTSQWKYFKFWLLASAYGYKIPYTKLKLSYEEYLKSKEIHNFYKYDGTILPKIKTPLRFSKDRKGVVKFTPRNNQLFSYDGSSSWYVQKFNYSNNLKWAKSSRAFTKIKSMRMKNFWKTRWSLENRGYDSLNQPFFHYFHYYANSSIFKIYMEPNIYGFGKQKKSKSVEINRYTNIFYGLFILFKRFIGISKLPEELKQIKKSKINRYEMNWSRRDSIDIKEILTDYEDIKLPDNSYFDKYKLSYKPEKDRDFQFFDEYAQLPEMYLFDFGSFSKHLAKQKFEAKELKQIEQFINDNLNNKNISFLEKSYMVYWLNTFTNNNLESKTKDYDSNIFSSQSKDRLGNTIKHGIYTIINNLDLYEKEGNLYQKKMDKKIKQLLKDKMSYADIWLQL